MSFSQGDGGNNQPAKFLLALHSTSETFGVACLNYRELDTSKKVSTFPLGRKLSKSLLSCVNDLLPSKAWYKIVRIAVATGPGGFTGTRLSVVMARTLSQQLGCSLDGVNSFSLMAPRLSSVLNSDQLQKPFWIVQEVPRRGVVAGCYQLKTADSVFALNDFLELEAPRLFSNRTEFEPHIAAKEDVAKDVACLLDHCLESHEAGHRSPWSQVLPLYPTSPVDQR